MAGGQQQLKRPLLVVLRHCTPPMPHAHDMESLWQSFRIHEARYLETRDYTTIKPRG